MPNDISHAEFAQRLQELSERIAALKTANAEDPALDTELSKRHMREAEQRHAELQAQFNKADKYGWEQFKVSLSQSLTDLIEEFSHIFSDADEKTRHRK